jgi:hypothetical protein
VQVQIASDLPATHPLKSEIAFIHAGLRTVPKSTILCSRGFVNGNSPFSSGFCWFSSDSVPLTAKFPHFPGQTFTKAVPLPAARSAH